MRNVIDSARYRIIINHMNAIITRRMCNYLIKARNILLFIKRRSYAYYQESSSNRRLR